MEFQQDLFNDLVIDHSVIQITTTPIKLKSGRESNFYVNWRNLTSDAFMVRVIADHVIKKSLDLGQIHGFRPDTFYGVPEGATGLGIITQYEWASFTPNYAPGSHVISLGRKISKSHGQVQDKYFIGQPKGRTILLEDTITTASSVLAELERLEDAGIDVVAVLALTDRMQLSENNRSAREQITSRGVIYDSLSNALSVLPLAYRKLKDGPDKLKLMEKLKLEFFDYGVEQLKL
ncbi:MAG TPA: hypothetical protein VJH68_05900 [Candidatus Nanoarchaeia archaeon]|nr:hypothetical protein [Candidatus Nanoarchaeia archaeon]